MRLWIAPMFRKLCSYRPEDPVRRIHFTQAIWYLRAKMETSRHDQAIASAALAATAAARAVLAELGQKNRDENAATPEHAANETNEQVIRRAMAVAGIGWRQEFDGSMELLRHVLLAIPTDTDDDRQNTARLRALATALLSKLVGYGGAIAGWEWSDWYHPDDPPGDWWPVALDDDREAEKTWKAEASRKKALRWPEIRLPDVPESGLIRVIAEAAAGLARQTTGAVEARVRPSMRQDHKVVYELCLEAGPSLTVVLFTAEVREKDLVISGWDDEETSLSDENSLRTFLSTVMQHPSTTYRIIQLGLARARLESRNAE